MARETRSDARVASEGPRPTMKGLSAAVAPVGAPSYCIETRRSLLRGFMKHPQLTWYTYKDNTMKTMTHRDYTAEIHYSEEDCCFVGRVVDIDDIVSFDGNTDEELRDAFEGMVDFYIEVVNKRDSAKTR